MSANHGQISDGGSGLKGERGAVPGSVKETAAGRHKEDVVRGQLHIRRFGPDPYR